MLRAAVPEAAVDEDCQLELRENKVRLTENGPFSAPAYDPVLSENVSESLLRVFVAAPPDARYDFRSLSRGENIGQLLYLHRFNPFIKGCYF